MDTNTRENFQRLTRTARALLTPIERLDADLICKRCWSPEMAAARALIIINQLTYRREQFRIYLRAWSFANLS